MEDVYPTDVQSKISLMMLNNPDDIMDIDNCNTYRDLCLADPKMCYHMKYNERLKECSDRTQVFIRTFLNRENGFENRWRLDFGTVHEMIMDELPSNLFTPDFRYNLNEGIEDLLEDTDIDIPYIGRVDAPIVVSKLYELMKTSPVFFDTVHSLFDDPKNNRIKKESKKKELIEKMFRFFLLRLMNRDDKAPLRYKRLSRGISDGYHFYNNGNTEWASSKRGKAILLQKQRQYFAKLRDRLLISDEEIIDIINEQDTFKPKPFNVFLKNEHKPDYRKKLTKKKTQSKKTKSKKTKSKKTKSKSKKIKDWRYIDDMGGIQGPFTKEQIREWVEIGYLNIDRQITSDEGENPSFSRIDSFPELISGINILPPEPEPEPEPEPLRSRTLSKSNSFDRWLETQDVNQSDYSPFYWEEIVKPGLQQYKTL
jgi:hypothetical protein